MPEFFSDDQMEAVRKTVRLVLFQTGHLRRDQDDGLNAAAEKGCWASITSSAAMDDDATRYKYAWTEQRETSDGWEDLPSGRTGTVTTNFAINDVEAGNCGQPGPVVGGPVVWIRFGWDTDGKATFRFSAANGGLIPVTITNDGGDDGDDSTAPTYTYGTFINAITGQEITMADGSSASGKSPAWARNIGEFNTATHGTVYIGSDGNPVLWQVDETEKGC